MAPATIEIFSALVLATSLFTFVTLAMGDYLVGNPSSSVEKVGSYFLTPVQYFSEIGLGISPFDEGLWAFGSLVTLVLSIAMLRKQEVGLGMSLLDAFTLYGTGVVVLFEMGVFLFIPQYFFSQVTNFVGRAGLGQIFTNWNVLLISLPVFGGRLCYRPVRFRMRARSTSNTRSG